MSFDETPKFSPGVPTVADGPGGPIIVGYRNQSGQQLPFRGDDSLPFVKDPPELSGMVLYRPDAALNAVLSVDQYETLDRINTEGVRTLELVVVFTSALVAAAPQGYLSIIAEKLRTVMGGKDELWVPQGVVDPVLQVPPSGSPLPIAQGYATRRFYSSELVFEPYNGQAPGSRGPFTAAITFDVTSAAAWRFRVGARNVAGATAAATAALYYDLQR